MMITKWTEKDKHRFVQALHMFPGSNKRIAEYIGTKTAEQVKERKKWIKKKARENGENWPDEEARDYRVMQPRLGHLPEPEF